MPGKGLGTATRRPSHLADGDFSMATSQAAKFFLLGRRGSAALPDEMLARRFGAYKYFFIPREYGSFGLKENGTIPFYRRFFQRDGR